MRRYIDEYYELPEKQWLGPNPESIKEMVLQQYKLGKTVDEIVKYLQTELYIFTDEEEMYLSCFLVSLRPSLSKSSVASA
jgi:hypothetical protein